MNKDILRFRYGPGKIVIRPIISQDEIMTIYGKEQELCKVEEMTEISESVNNKEENENDRSREE